MGEEGTEGALPMALSLLSGVRRGPDREDYLRREGQIKRQRPAQKKKKEAEQPKKKEGKHGPCPYCKGAKTKMHYGNYVKHLLEQHHCDMGGSHACPTYRHGCSAAFYKYAERTAHEQACRAGLLSYMCGASVRGLIIAIK